MEKEAKYLLTSKLITSMISGFLIVALPIYLLDLGLAVSKIGFIFGIAMFIYGILTFYMGSLSESTGRLWVGILTIIGMIIGTTLFGLIPLFSISLGLVIFVIAKIMFSLSDTIQFNIVKRIT